MKCIHRRWIAGGLAAVMLAGALGGCGQKKMDQAAIEQMQADFDAFINDEFVAEMESSWLSTHVFMEHPENYGVDRSKIKVELAAPINEAYFAEAKEKLKETKKAFDAFDIQYLTEDQQAIYMAYAYKLNCGLESSKDEFKYFGFDFGTLSGSYNQIPTLFADLELRDEQDVKDLVVLLESTDDYLCSSADFLKEQAAHGTLMIDKENIQSFCENIVDLGMESSTLTSMVSHIEEMSLDAEDKKDYIEAVETAFEDSYLSAYAYILEVLDELDDADNVQGGLANVKNGKAYYELLFRNATGSTKSIAEMKKLLKENLDEAINTLSTLAMADYEVYDNYVNGVYESGFDDFGEMLTFLGEAISEDFPEVGKIEYTIDPLAADLQVDGVQAYYNTPPLDNTRKQKIRVNMADDTRDRKSLDTFCTVAHEGIPGHMYQHNYCYHLNLPEWITTIGTNIGFSEGYATYVQLNALPYLEDLPDGVAELDKAMEEVNFMAVALCDIAVHYDGMDVPALEAYLDKIGLNSGIAGELMGQLRANPCVFLSYYVGYAEIKALREKAEKSLGDKFDAKTFHTALLAYGPATFDAVEKSVDAYISEAQK